ncbi:flotillin family protein [Candidatus Nomurabacteria bacterium]|nr:flotillin family protein [Candidatus Nomurabacteria bacterium]
MLVIGGFAILALIAMIYARNYVKVPPNQVAVFTGRGKQKIVRGGARFKFPLIERVDVMELEPFNVQVAVSNIISTDGVPVNVDGVGLIKFGSTDEAIATAVERFLTSDRRELHNQVQEILAGNMRGIVSQMTVEELNNNREDFRRRVLEEAGTDFQRIGMELDVLTIQNISDPNGYLESLGRRRIAEVRRDAEIGEANAQRDAKIAAAEAKREGDTAQALADVAIAQAEQDRDLELARIQATVDAERATAAQSGPRADAEARKAVVVANAAADQAEEEARVEVERQRALRAHEAQQADVIIPAQAAKEAAIEKATGDKAAAIARSEAEAEGIRLRGDAEAAARATTADARQRELEAEAAGAQARLLAEAEGQAKLAEALKAMDAAALRAQATPMLIERLADIMRAVGEPLAGIDNITVLDGGGANGLGGFMDQLPTQLARGLMMLKAVGVDFSGLFGEESQSTTLSEADMPETENLAL